MRGCLEALKLMLLSVWSSAPKVWPAKEFSKVEISWDIQIAVN